MDHYHYNHFNLNIKAFYLQVITELRVYLIEIKHFIITPPHQKYFIHYIYDLLMFFVIFYIILYVITIKIVIIVVIIITESNVIGLNVIIRLILTLIFI